MQRTPKAMLPQTRIALAVLVVTEVATLATIWLLALPQTAYAYVDPSVMTYTIQALAGVAVALSAVAGVAFRRARRKVYKTLNIDENANKAVEGQIVRIDPASSQASVEFLGADERACKLLEESANDSEKRGIASLKWPKRFAFSLLACLFAFFVILIAPALEIFGSNAESLVFQLDNVWWITVSINCAFAVVLALVLSLLRGKVFMRAMLFVFCLTVAAYVQAFFLNGGMMPADGGYIDWREPYFVMKMVVSGIVWACILVIPQLLCASRRYSWLKATSAIAAAIIIVQGVGVISVAIEASGKMVDNHARPYVTQGNLYEVHPEKNVIVLVLDTFDTRLMEELREQDPNLLDGLTDFTYFKNSVGMMIPTANAIPYLLTGDTPEPGQDLGDYREHRYENGSAIPDIEDAGYTVDIYTDSAMLDFHRGADAEVARISGNIHMMKRAPIDVWAAYLAMDQMALYRESPWVLKPLFWYYTTDINNRMIGDGPEFVPVDENPDDADMGHERIYELDDAQILKELRENGLVATDRSHGADDEGDSEGGNGADGKGGSEAGSEGGNEDGHEGAFKFIHLYGPHFPFNMDENGQDVGVGKSDQPRQAKGSFMLAKRYIEELKRLGVYDDATIVITADHGIWDEKEDPVKHATSPIMLVKPSMPDGGTGAECVVSDMPVDHSDILPTVMEAMGLDPSQYGSGLTVWDIDDPRRPRYFDALTTEGEGGRRFVEYEIVGDALDLSNWSKTGNEWPEK